MARKVDYPRASFKKALELATQVDELGGQCTLDLAADKIGMKVGGGFLGVVGASVKHGLVKKSQNKLYVTQLFKDYRLAYSEKEENKALIQAFMKPPLYAAIIDRFRGMALPTSHLDRILVREFEVPDKLASRLVKYLVEGSKQLGILGQGNELLLHDIAGLGESKEVLTTVDPSVPTHRVQASAPKPLNPLVSGKYFVHIQGPGIDSVVTIESESDIGIVNAMLRKVEQSLVKLEKEEPSDES